jgi:hypothetical protein
MRILKYIIVLILLLIPTQVTAENNKGDVVASKYVCKTPYYLIQFENVKNNEEAMKLYSTSVEALDCMYSNVRYLFVLKDKIYSYVGLEGLAQIWGTEEGVFIIVNVNSEQFKISVDF